MYISPIFRGLHLASTHNYGSLIGSAVTQYGNLPVDFYKSMSALKYTVGPKRRSYHFPCTHIGRLHHEHTDEDASPLSNPLQHWLNRGPSTAGEPLCKIETHCTVLQEQSVSLRTRECSREEIGDKPLFPWILHWTLRVNLPGHCSTS